MIGHNYNHNNYSTTINPYTQVLINRNSFFIYEHQYVEFSGDFSMSHHNRQQDNANLLYFFLEGGGHIDFRNEKIPLKAGDIAFYPCIKSEMYSTVIYPGTKKVVIGFYFNIFSSDDIFSELRQPIVIKDSMNLIPLIKQAVTSETEAENMLLSSYVMISLKPVFQLVNEKIATSLMKGMQYSSVFEYIDNNLYIDLTLEQISQNTNLSVSYLTHAFPKNTGFSIKEYIHKNIMKYICLDLTYTELRIKDIAIKYHFGSESYFSEWFYKKYNKRPSEYRRIFKNFQEYHLYKQLR